jgi:hypothetical protein
MPRPSRTVVRGYFAILPVFQRSDDPHGDGRLLVVDYSSGGQETFSRAVGDEC